MTRIHIQMESAKSTSFPRREQQGTRHLEGGRAVEKGTWEMRKWEPHRHVFYFTVWPSLCLKGFFGGQPGAA